jgi:hypothetical protein
MRPLGNEKAKDLFEEGTIGELNYAERFWAAQRSDRGLAGTTLRGAPTRLQSVPQAPSPRCALA